ncbi:MAG TPA: hypothetical protein VN823_25800 [Stellaceae bacterium]|nr:hypothetical protein [Stellaceae bacterium]
MPRARFGVRKDWLCPAEIGFRIGFAEAPLVDSIQRIGFDLQDLIFRERLDLSGLSIPITDASVAKLGSFRKIWF